MHQAYPAGQSLNTMTPYLNEGKYNILIKTFSMTLASAHLSNVNNGSKHPTQILPNSWNSKKTLTCPHQKVNNRSKSDGHYVI